MKTIELEEATSPLEEYARKVKKEPVIVTQGGRPVAALVPIHADLETVKLSTNPEFLALIERSRARQKTEGGITSSELRRRLGRRSRNR